MKGLILDIHQLHRLVLEKEQFIESIYGEKIAWHFRREAERLKFQYIFLRDGVPCDADYRLIQNMLEFVRGIKV